MLTTQQRARVEQLGAMRWGLWPREQMQLFSWSLPLQRQDGFMFFPLTLKSRKGNPGWVISGRTFSLLTRTLQVLAQSRDLSAHLRPVLTCPRAVRGGIPRYLCITILSQAPDGLAVELGQEPSPPGLWAHGGGRSGWCTPALPLLQASHLQVQTTKKAQVSNALKIST